ncbi:MAG: UDP-N-acetylmuramate--L-alanine ligase [bacterium JZ-2024 1]
MKLFFSGIGGSGMSALAALCLDRGWQVMGSDSAWSPVLDTLTARGAEVFVPQTGDRVDAPDVFVYTTALPEDHPELNEARRRGIAMKPRPEFLRDLFTEKRNRVAVTGSHGKTTTTAMLGHILYEVGRSPSVVVGGIVRSWGVGGRWGTGDVFVAEADESRPTFRMLNPTHLILCNLDLDHVEAYPTIDRLAHEMAQFGMSIPPEGAIWVGGKDDTLQKLTQTWESSGRYVRTYAVGESADVTGTITGKEPGGTRFMVTYGDRKIGEFFVAEIGRHIVHDALGAMAMAAELGVPFQESGRALESFAGVARRWEILGIASGATIVSDYAHHPTEIKCLLETARMTQRRIIVVFQPHRYTRTRFLGSKIGDALRNADFVIVTDVYSAGEPETLKTDGREVYEAVVAGNPSAMYAPVKEVVFEHLRRHMRPNDLILFVGAGSIHSWAKEFLGNAEDAK